jgi:hypothetical protein
MLAVLLTISVFTPLVIPEARFQPMLFGLPYTLWVGILVTIIYIILTWQAATIYKKMEEEGRS